MTRVGDWLALSEALARAGRPVDSFYATREAKDFFSPEEFRKAHSLVVLRAQPEETLDEAKLKARLKADASDVPLIVVGGGSFLVPERVAGISEVVQVPHQAVANAVGAGLRVASFARAASDLEELFLQVTSADPMPAPPPADAGATAGWMQA